MHRVTECPVCQGTKFNSIFDCQDYTVSHETFSLIECAACHLLITSPRPTDQNLGSYYLSEDYISHSNKSTSILDLIYKISRFFTLRWKAALITKYAASKVLPTILDYGCGTGDFLNHMKTLHWDTAGVEPSALARLQAEKLNQHPMAQNLTDVSGSFTCITLWHVLEHVADLNQTVHSLSSLLAKNGTMFIAVPNHESMDAIRYKNHWAGYDVPRHLWHFSKENMSLLLRKHGLTVKKIEPMKLDSFYVSMLSEKYIRQKTSLSGLASAFITGLKSNNSGRKNGGYSSLIYIAQK